MISLYSLFPKFSPVATGPVKPNFPFPFLKLALVGFGSWSCHEDRLFLWPRLQLAPACPRHEFRLNWDCPSLFRPDFPAPTAWFISWKPPVKPWSVHVIQTKMVPTHHRGNQELNSCTGISLQMRKHPFFFFWHLILKWMIIPRLFPWVHLAWLATNRALALWKEGHGLLQNHGHP